MVSPDPPGHLDVPLVWGGETRDQGSSSAGVPRPQGDSRSQGIRLWELWIAYLADTGIVLLCIGSTWVLAAVGGAGLNPLQIVLSAIVGVEIAAFVITATVWTWRGSPGMLLANLVFAKPVALSDALALCFIWHLVLPVLGLPLLVRRRGATWAERLAGAAINPRSPRGAA
jgi:hypothetical protein